VTVVRAPGRVNLIGEHTDYSDGLCLPVAIDRECRIQVSPRADRTIRARSRQVEGVVELRAGAAPSGPAWGRFVAGAVTVVSGRGHPVGGRDLLVDSTVPTGSGLSSSSALAVALVLALLPVDAPERDDPRVLAHLALDAEIEATGVPGGLLDQMASLCGREGHALLLDCRTLSVEPVPLPDGLAIVVVDSGIARRLADSEYAERRMACDVAARRLGVPALRDADLAAVADDPIARHVVTENRRVLETAAALRAGDPTTAGALLVAGHESLRDDFRVSLPTLDRLVDLLVEHGAYGARLTGAGFGGCVVGLVAEDRVEACLAGVLAAAPPGTDRPVTGFRVRAVAGAGLSA
jgi:galactokinase